MSTATMLWPWAVVGVASAIGMFYVALQIEPLEDVLLQAFLFCVGALAIGLAIGLGVAEVVQ